MEREVIIRPLDAVEATERAAELASILLDAVAGGASVNFMGGLTAAEAERFWREQIPGLADGARHLLVADDGTGLLGTVILTLAPQPNAPNRGEIGKMLVARHARNRGLGRDLLLAAERLALALGRTTLILDTETGSAGERLYRRSGWTAFGTVPRHSFTPSGAVASATFFYKHLG